MSWTIQTMPVPAGAPGGELDSVSCASPASCTAVGWYVPTAGGENLPLAEHWDGPAGPFRLRSPQLAAESCSACPAPPPSTASPSVKAPG